MTNETVTEQSTEYERYLKKMENKKGLFEESLQILKQKEEEVAIQKKQLEEEVVELQKLRADLIQREKSLQTRELNAELGFANENEAALRVFEKEKEKLTKQFEKDKSVLHKQLDTKRKEIEKLIEQLEKDFANKKQQVESSVENMKKEQLSKLEKQYDVQKKEIEQQLTKYKADMMQIIARKESVVEEAQNQLNTEIVQLTKEKDSIQKERQSLNNKAVELQEREDDFDFEREMFLKDKQLFEEKVQQAIAERLELANKQYDQQKQYQTTLIDKIVYLQKQLEEKEEQELRSGTRTPVDLLNEIDVLKQQISDLKKELQMRPAQNILIELEEKARQYESILESNNELQKKLVKHEQQEHKYLMSVSRLQQEKEKYEFEVKRREVIEAQIEKYILEVNRLKALHEQPKEIEARRGVIEEAYFDKKTFFSAESIEEIDWLKHIIKQCEKSGLKFNERLFYSFHTALKTSDYSPLTVLAGVSGTGKSELPRLYARFGGLYFLPLAVQPDWDSPQSLFGYFNSVDNRFNATLLLRSLVQFQQNKNARTLSANLNDSVLLVLLDEMNLAHVELYFSELLSKLETRRGETSAVNIEIDLGAGVDKYPVELSRNVLWVGTMNEDETTKSLSDKVIDRGNMLSFPRPTKFERRLQTKLEAESPKLSRKIWNHWLDQKVELADEIEKYKSALEEINAYLEEVGRALGHRVWQSAENYIANHPHVIAAKQEGKADELDLQIRRAFEEALVHKVMPKLRGIEVDSSTARNKCLEPISAIIHEYAPGLYRDFQLAMTNAYGVFIWRSAKYLEDNES
ncbi:hypothetical protein [Bacillus paranthracis]|uniref:hypothetical protein n=1 Tax=Bacillus paranthracis TaxID=2026186 RepID=UPI0020B8C478|nr:hypothetical protein MON10_25525 [Bacillus paranthracis]